MKNIYLLSLALFIFSQPVMAATKLSQITTGGTIAPSTDQIVAVRNGTSDVLVTPGTAPIQKTSNFTFGSNDVGALDYVQSSSAVTATLPQAGTTGFAANTCFNITNIGTGSTTVSPTTSTINLASSIVIPSGGFASICSDGTNYEAQAYLGTSSTGVTSLNSLTGALNIAAGSNITVTPSGSTITISSSSSASSTLGTSAGAASPQISGDATSGFYTAGAAKVDVAISNANVVEWGAGTEKIAGTETITSNSATALLIGPNGATNPVLTINDSVASQVAGLSIAGAVTGGTVGLAAIDSGTNTSISLSSKGAGKATLNSTGAGSVALDIQSTDILLVKVQNNGDTIGFSPAAYNTGTVTHFLLNGPADTGLTASTNVPVEYFNNGLNNRQHSTGALTLQEDMSITGATDTFVGASTLTDGATLGLSPKSCGTNGTCTNESSLLIPTAALTGTVSNGYGAKIAAPSGATNNYALQTTGVSQVGPLISTNTTFTVSGCSATSPVGGATAGKFTSGTTGTCTAVITVNGATGATAPNGWACSGNDLTTNADLITQTATTTTTATLSGTTASGDVINFYCIGY